MSIIHCDHNSQAPRDILLSLPVREQGIARWKCAVCAYNEGFSLSGTGKWKSIENYFNGIPEEKLHRCPDNNFCEKSIVQKLEISQKGIQNKQSIQRHKCPVCAFNLGMRHGFLIEDLEQKSKYFDSVEVSPPNGQATKNIAYNSNENLSNSQEQLDKDNKNLGNLGEKLVIQMEKNALIKAGFFDLAEKVEWVAETKGDYLGYDVHSYTKLGNDKWIEVKTTTGSINTPFHISVNQLEVSKLSPEKYQLYRLFKVDEKSQKFSYFKICGDLYNKLNLLPMSFKAVVK